MADTKLSNPLLSSDIELGYMGKSLGDTLFNKAGEFMATLGFKDDLTKVSQILKNYAPVMVDTPFQGSSLVMTQDEQQFVFGSREGRIGVVNRELRQVVLDQDIKQGSIWTMTLIANDKYILSAGASTDIKKISFPGLEEVDIFRGHENEINFIQVSKDEKIMYSGSDDRTVRMWPLDKPPGTAVSEVLYTDSGVIYAIDLSVDNKYIASCGSNSMIIYSLDSRKILVQEVCKNWSAYWGIKISTNNNWIAAGNQTGQVVVWEFGSWKELKVIQAHGARVRYMSAALDESFIVTAGLDHLIKIWDMKTNKPPITLTGHSNWVKFALVSQNQSTIFSISDDKKVASWKIPNFKDVSTFAHEQDEFKSLDASDRYLFASTEQKILAYDYSGNKSKEIDVSKFKIASFSVNNDGTKFYVFADLGQIGFKLFGWRIEDESMILNLDLSQEKLFSGIVLKNEQIAVSGDNVRVHVWDIQTKKSLKVFRTHRSDVTVLMATNNSTKLFSSDSASIKVYDTVKWEVVHSIEECGLRFMVTSRDDEYFFYANNNMQLHIYSIDTMSLLRDFPRFSSKKIYFTKDNDHYIYCTGRTLYIRDLDNFEKICALATDSDIVDFSVSPDESVLVTSTGTVTTFQMNPLKCKSFNIFGDTERFYEYIRYCNQIMSSDRKEYIKEFDDWIIEPYHMNTAHLYSNYNCSDLMKKAVLAHAPFYPSRTDHTPLSIATDKKFVDIIEAIFQGLRDRLQAGDVWAFYHIGKSLTGLNKLGFANLHKIYDLALFRSHDINLPKFAIEKASLPVVVYSDHPLINKHDFPDQAIFIDEGKAIAFGQTSFRLDLELGTQGSLNLVQSILECENEQIYYTKLVQLILNSKWQKVRTFIGVQAIIYSVYLLWLAAYSLWDYDETLELIVPCVLSTLLFIYEIIQLYNTGIDYFTDMWNYVDITRALLFYVFCIWSWLGDDSGEISLGKETMNQLFTLLVLFSWLRGITYFKLFERTRYLIKLIIEASVDILSFFILLFYSTLAFAFIMQSVDYSRAVKEDAVCFEQGYTIDCYFLNSYVQNLGEFSASPTNFLTWVLFIIISIVNPVIMLNLLISIMGDTYGRVKAGKVVADYREIAGMILEVETLMSWNRLTDKKMFLKIMCEEVYLKGGEKTAEELIEDLDRKIDTFQKDINGFELQAVNDLNSAQSQIFTELEMKGL